MVRVIGDAGEIGSPASGAPQTAAASHPLCPSTVYDGESHEGEHVLSHTSPPPIARPVHESSGDQQFKFDQFMATLASNNPREANPEGAELPINQEAVQAINDEEEMASPSTGSADTDFDQVPEQPTSLAGHDGEYERVHFHRAPRPVLTLLSMATGVTFTEEQPHFTMEQAVAILTSDAVWASSTPPARR